MQLYVLTKFFDKAKGPLPNACRVGGSQEVRRQEFWVAGAICRHCGFKRPITDSLKTNKAIYYLHHHRRYAAHSCLGFEKDYRLNTDPAYVLITLAHHIGTYVRVFGGTFVHPRRAPSAASGHNTQGYLDRYLGIYRR